MTDLAGQPYLPVNRDTSDALATVPAIQAALHNYGPDDVPDVRPRPVDTLPAEMLGMLHGRLAFFAAQQRRGDDARAHLNEAETIAGRVGECTGMGRHFGPTYPVEPDRPGLGDRSEPAGPAPADVIYELVEQAFTLAPMCR